MHSISLLECTIIYLITLELTSWAYSNIQFFYHAELYCEEYLWAFIFIDIHDTF